MKRVPVWVEITTPPTWWQNFLAVHPDVDFCEINRILGNWQAKYVCDASVGSCKYWILFVNAEVQCAFELAYSSSLIPVVEHNRLTS